MRQLQRVEPFSCGPDRCFEIVRGRVREEDCFVVGVPEEDIQLNPLRHMPRHGHVSQDRLHGIAKILDPYASVRGLVHKHHNGVVDHVEIVGLGILVGLRLNGLFALRHVREDARRGTGRLGLRVGVFLEVEVLESVAQFGELEFLS